MTILSKLVIHLDYYSVIKKKDEVMPFAAIWVDLEITMLNEVNQTGKDSYHMISVTYGI